MFGQDPMFWASAMIAAALRVLLAERMHMRRALVSFTTAVFAAWAFTDAVLHWLDLDADIYKYPIAACVAVTAENIVRIFLMSTRDTRAFADLFARIIQAWRGK